MSLAYKVSVPDFPTQELSKPCVMNTFWNPGKKRHQPTFRTAIW